MTPIEAMKMALNALKVGNTHTIATDIYHRDNKVIHALTEAIEQMEKATPVAWMRTDRHKVLWLYGPVEDHHEGAVPLYAHPAPAIVRAAAEIGKATENQYD